MRSTIALRRLHGVLTLLWAAVMPLSLWTGWVKSVTFVSVLSIYALAAAHFSAWQSSRVEVKQDEVEDEADEHFEGRIEAKVDSIERKLGD